MKKSTRRTKRTRSKKLNRSKKLHKYTNKRKSKVRRNKSKKRKSKKMKGGFTHFYIPGHEFESFKSPDFNVDGFKIEQTMGRFLRKKCLKN